MKKGHAALLLKRHGEDATLVAAQRVDEMLAKGDVEGLAAELDAVTTQDPRSAPHRDLRGSIAE